MNEIQREVKNQLRDPLLNVFSDGTGVLVLIVFSVVSLFTILWMWGIVSTMITQTTWFSNENSSYLDNVTIRSDSSANSSNKDLLERSASRGSETLFSAWTKQVEAYKSVSKSMLSGRNRARLDRSFSVFGNSEKRRLKNESGIEKF